MLESTTTFVQNWKVAFVSESAEAASYASNESDYAQIKSDGKLIRESCREEGASGHGCMFLAPAGCGHEAESLATCRQECRRDAAAAADVAPTF